MQKTKIKVKVNGLKVENKQHLDAQIRFPARIQENKKVYKRARNKVNDQKIIEKED